MFDEVSLSTVKETLNFAGKNRNFEGENSIPDLQTKGVTALCKILRESQYAYLADEVGMGKTYQALGVISMLIREKKNAQILIIAPNEAVQKNWINEIKNFSKNILEDDYLEIADKLFCEQKENPWSAHPVDIIKEYALKRKKATIYIVRLTAFSGVGEKVTKLGNRGFSYSHNNISARDLFNGIETITNRYMQSGRGSFDSCDAGKICGCALRKYTPKFDLVVIDEAQNIRNKNNATAFLNYWLGLRRFNRETNLNVEEKLQELSKNNSVSKERKYLLLSATPAHRGVESLRNQLLYFEKAKNIPQIDHDYLEQFMIRRLRTYNGDSKYAVRNIRPDDVARDISIEQRLFLALVQSKLAQHQSANNATFKIGFLETFESYDATSFTASDEETGEKGKEFENGGSAKQEERGAAQDKQMLLSIAKSYAKQFDGKKCPPHPKLNFMEDEIKECLQINIESMNSNQSPEKSIVFVRRLASVDELVNHRLNRLYEEQIIKYWAKKIEIDKKNIELKDIQIAFEELYTNSKLQNRDMNEDDESEEDGDVEESDENSDEDVKSALLRWIAIKKKDTNFDYSCVSLFKKSMLKNKTNSILFDENYYRTAHVDEDDDVFKERVTKLVDSKFVDEVTSYIEAEPKRYIQESKGKKKYNNSNLQVLCCCIALAFENHPIADRLFEFYDIKDKCKTSQNRIERQQIEKVLAQSSIWNMLCDDNTIGNVLINWFTVVDFSKREAMKNWTEKYLKSSEAVLELLYCYCMLEDRRDKDLFQKKVYESIFGAKSTHGQRVRLLFENAELVCNQLLGGIEIDYKYNPAFMNLQQWVMPATGGSNGNEALIKRFNTPFYPDVIVCTDVLKEGINLHLFCNRVYHYGLAWTPGDLEQRIGRVDRFFSKTHRDRLNKLHTKVEVNYPYMGKSVDENQLRKVLQFKLSADPLLDSSSYAKKDIEIDLDTTSIEDIAKYVPSEEKSTIFPYSGERFWNEKFQDKRE
ncbi:MAG: helicase-related protein [Eubacteriales bacterium]|nr:helicase-related protein [Eubacteriales bacterium]